MLARILRIAVRNDALVAPLDVATGKPPELWAGSPVLLLLAFASGSTFAAPPALTGVQVQLKAARCGAAPDDTAPVLALAEAGLSAGELTDADWATGAAAHATLDFPGESLALPAGAYWLVIIGHDALGNPATLAAGKIRLLGDGYASGVPAPAPVLSAADTAAAKAAEAAESAGLAAGAAAAAQSAGNGAQTDRAAIRDLLTAAQAERDALGGLLTASGVERAAIADLLLGAQSAGDTLAALLAAAQTDRTALGNLVGPAQADRTAIGNLMTGASADRTAIGGLLTQAQGDRTSAAQAATEAQAAKVAAEAAIATAIQEYANLAAFPASGASGKVYHALDTGLKYIWRSGAYELFVRKASVADAIAGADDSKAVTPAGVRAALTTVRNDFRRFSRAGFSVSVSGAGATAATGDIGASWMGPNAGVAGYVYGRPFGISQINQTAQLLRIGVAGNSGYDFAKRIVLTGTSLFSGISTGVTCWVTLGKGEGVRGNPTTRSIGWRRVGAGVLELVVHNGADLVAVATTVSPSGAFHWQLVNHGTGVVEFYVNDVLVASSAAGPTGPSNAITATYAEEIDCTGAQSWRPELWCSGGGLFHAI